MKAPEGVAAPLEPTQDEAFEIATQILVDYGRLNPNSQAFEARSRVIAKRIRDHAAAVSKNLQQSVEQLCGDLKAIQQDYTNEKKRADGLQEELALVKRVLLQHLNDEDFEYSLVGLYTKLTENDAGKSPR